MFMKNLELKVIDLCVITHEGMFWLGSIIGLFFHHEYLD